MEKTNDASSTIDYKKWSKTDLWKLQEGICLLLGVEPKPNMFINRKYHEYQAPIFWKEFDKLAKMVERSVTAGNLHPYVRHPNLLSCEIFPDIFIKWAISKEIEIPTTLYNLFNNNEMITSNTTQRDEQVTPKEPTPRKSQVTKQICQAIAKTLWDIDPNMTIEDMKKHSAILEHGGGKHYAGRNTLRDWLSEVDPRSPKSKTGRPRNNTRKA